MRGEQLTFEVVLNPSVIASEAARLSRQAIEILDLLRTAWRDRRLVRTSELRALAGQYNARLFEVRRALVKRGFCVDLIERDTETGNNGYAIVPVEKSTFYARHKERFE